MRKSALSARLACATRTLLAVALIFTGHAAAQTPVPTLTTLHTFVAPPRDGISPVGLAAASDGVLYGATQFGGPGSCTDFGTPPGCGTLFSLTPPSSGGDAWTRTVLYSFSGGSDGAYPAGVAIGSDGSLYGVTTYGGSGDCVTQNFPSGCGTVFELTPPAVAGQAWTKRSLYSFMGGSDASAPKANVVIGSGGVIYGTALAGGTEGGGAVFSLTPPAGASSEPWTESVLYNLNCNGPCFPSGVVVGSEPSGSPVLYGVQGGTVFSLTPPVGPSGSGGEWTKAVLYDAGGGPAGVVIGSGGVLYGTTEYGGASNLGSVFALSPPLSSFSSPGPWKASILHSFNNASAGQMPVTGVIVGNGGVLYGTTSSGGTSGFGVVFSLTPPAIPSGDWIEKAIFDFTVGTLPVAFEEGGGLEVVPSTFSGLVAGKGGMIYGVSASSGSGGYNGYGGSGAVYALIPPSPKDAAWTVSTVYNFAGLSPGANALSSLAIGAGGVLYGTTQGGGAGSCPLGCGTVFSLTPPAAGSSEWTENLLYTFMGGVDGAYPSGGLAIAGNGVLYGTAQYGGAGPCTTYGEPPGCGVVFSLTPPAASDEAWAETTLHSFNTAFNTCFLPCAGYTDGVYPAAGVVIGSGGVLYGTTQYGGTGPSGTLFSLTPPASPLGVWTETVLYNFDSYIESLIVSADASGPAIGSDGVVYGMGSVADCGFPFNCLAVFALTSPLGGSDGANGTWAETVLQTFFPLVGGAALPDQRVTLGSGGVLYGTVPPYYFEVGTQTAFAFSLAPPTSSSGSWTESPIYSFAPLDAAGILSGFAIGSGGVLYGTAQYGGPGPCSSSGITGCGNVYALIPPKSPGGQWTEVTLHNFTGGSDGAYPLNGVVIGDGGVLYGTASGAANIGTVFALNVGKGPTPMVDPGVVVSAASYTALVAPGSLASAFGTFLLSSPLSATQSPLPDDLSGLSLEFGGGIQAPLFYVSGGQVNFQVPWEVSAGSQASVTAVLNGAAGDTQRVNVAPYAPAIFTDDAGGLGQGAIVDTSYRLVDANNPATAGSSVLIYCTGLGDVSNRPATGASAPAYPLAQSATPLVTIGGVNADVQFSGLAPGYVGLYQVNVVVPAGIPTNSSAPVMISIGGVTSNSVTMAVQ